MDSDEALVLRARAGDRAAFASLIARHRPMLLTVCRRLLGDSAEDVAQDAVLQALLSLDRLQQPERFGPWLAGIGLNLARRLRRERGMVSWEDLCGGLLAGKVADGSLGPAELAEEAELTCRVRQAVMELPRGQRAAVLLFYLSGLTYAETAATLGIPLSAVKNRLHKARASLRRDLLMVWKEDLMEVEEMVEARIVDVREEPAEEEDQRSKFLVVLEDVAGERLLNIWIGQAEATAISLQLAGVEAPRPLTYAFTAAAIRALGGRVTGVTINRLADEVFFASVALDGPNGSVTVDARPSDALALALTFKAPIKIARSILETQGFLATERSGPEPDRGKAIAAVVEQYEAMRLKRQSEQKAP